MGSLPVTDSMRGGGSWLGQGAIGGLLGGAAFLAFEIAVAAITMGAAWALFPLRLFAGILLGPGAVDPGSPAVPVGVAGVLVHVTLSAAFGMLFASLTQPARERAVPRRPGTMLAAAAAYGFALWLVNFYVVAPLAGWHWFPRDTNPIVQLIAHVVVYGLFVGSYLDRVEARDRATALIGERALDAVDERRRPAA